MAEATLDRTTQDAIDAVDTRIFIEQEQARLQQARTLDETRMLEALDADDGTSVPAAIATLSTATPATTIRVWNKATGVASTIGHDQIGARLGIQRFPPDFEVEELRRQRVFSRFPVPVEEPVVTPSCYCILDTRHPDHGDIVALGKGTLRCMRSAPLSSSVEAERHVRMKHRETYSALKEYREKQRQDEMLEEQRRQTAAMQAQTEALLTIAHGGGIAPPPAPPRPEPAPEPTIAAASTAVVVDMPVAQTTTASVSKPAEPPGRRVRRELTAEQREMARAALARGRATRAANRAARAAEQQEG